MKTDHGPLFISKFLANICAYFKFKHLTTTAYHPQTKCQVERYDMKIVTRPRLYIADHRQNSKFFVQSHTYTCNTQVNRSTNTSPYNLLLIRLQPEPSVVQADSDRLCSQQPEPSQQQMHATLQARILELRNKTGTHLQKLQAKFKYN